MLTLKESNTITELAGLLYDFLPGSGNSRTAFPLAAAQVGVGDFWLPGSKKPGIVALLSQTLEQRRSKFCPLILAIVHQALAYRRGKGNPLTRAEIVRLNELLPGVEFKIPELHDQEFLRTLSGTPTRTGATEAASRPAIDPKVLAGLATELVALTSLAPQPRGYAFEGFLKRLFDAHGLSARAAFRIVGEQIDGSFVLEGETYLLEARWRNERADASDLHAFAGKVGGKAAWARGLFISQAGFSDEGLEAYGRGRPTSIICMEGLDLYDALSRGLPIDEVIARKVRRAAETGIPLARVRDLFPV